MFRYKSLEWHTSDVGRGPATAGENAGDRVNGINVTNDPEVMKNMLLVYMSNVDKPGLFIYRVDLGPSELLLVVVMSLVHIMSVLRPIILLYVQILVL